MILTYGQSEKYSIKEFFKSYAGYELVDLLGPVQTGIC